MFNEMKRSSAFIGTCDYQGIILTTPNHHDFVLFVSLARFFMPIEEILIPYISKDITTLRAYNSFLCYAKMLFQAD